MLFRSESITIRPFMANMSAGSGFTFVIFVKAQIIGYFYGFLFGFDLTIAHQ